MARSEKRLPIQKAWLAGLTAGMLLLLGSMTPFLAVAAEGASTKAGQADWQATYGSWSYTDEHIVSKSAGVGDAFAIGDQKLDTTEAFVLECPATYSGHAYGLVFGVSDRSDPASDWYCLNYSDNDGIARAFHVVNGALDWNISFGLTSAMKDKGNTHDFRVVYIPGGMMSFYVDDELLGTHTAEGFTGVYYGVMTCIADGEFTYPSYETFTAEFLTDLTVHDAECVYPYGASINDFVVYTEHETEQLAITAEFADHVTTVALDPMGNTHTLVSGQRTAMPLKVGYNRIQLTATISIGGTTIENIYHINIHRAQDADVLYHEDLRPQTHYSDPTGYINDPNGLCYNAATGEYHLFYQTVPRDSFVNANQAWNHAVSKDLVHWEYKGAAIEADELGFCWSGSACIDVHNTSGLFDEDSDPNGRMVLLYSSVYGDTYYGTEKISLAYSEDNGETWKKYEGNPVVRNGENHVQEYNQGFRDPKIIWYEDDSYAHGGVWIMLIGGGPGYLFVSENLLDWTYHSTVCASDGTPLQGECPDIFKIEVENQPGTYKWVYVSGQLDVNAGIFQTGAAVGELYKNEEGKFEFVADQSNMSILYGGYNLYATQSFYSTADGRRIQISWIREWLSMTGPDLEDNEVKDWRGLMSWPMELTLEEQNGAYVFKSRPVAEMESLRGEPVATIQNTEVKATDENILGEVSALNPEIEVTLHLRDADKVTFALRQGRRERGLKIIVSDYDPISGTVKLTADGTSARGNTAEVTVSAPNGQLTLRMVADANTIEVYANDGEGVAVAMAYPSKDSLSMSMSVTGGQVEVESLVVYDLASIYDAVSDEEETEPESGSTPDLTEPTPDSATEPTGGEMPTEPDSLPADTQPAPSGGCRSSLAGATLMSMPIGAAALVIRKKRNRNQPKKET